MNFALRIYFFCTRIVPNQNSGQDAKQKKYDFNRNLLILLVGHQGIEP